MQARTLRAGWVCPDCGETVSDFDTHKRNCSGKDVSTPDRARAYLNRKVANLAPEEWDRVAKALHMLLEAQKA